MRVCEKTLTAEQKAKSQHIRCLQRTDTDTNLLFLGPESDTTEHKRLLAQETGEVLAAAVRKLAVAQFTYEMTGSDATLAPIIQ